MMSQPPLSFGHMVAFVAALAVLGACGSDDDPAYEPQPMAFHAIGGLQLQVKGAAVDLGLAGLSATATIQHGLADDGVCVEQVEVLSAQTDGSCAISLRFVHAPDQPGMKLAAASVQIRPVGAPLCAALAAVVPDEGVEVLELSSGTATLPIGGWAETLASQTASPARLDKLYLWPRGEVTFKGGEVEATGQLDGLRFGGDTTSDLAASATCKPCSDGPCAVPVPTFRLRDMQPKSVAYNLNYGMDVFLGQPLLAIPQAGW